MGRFRKHAKPEDPKVQSRRLVSKKLALGMARHTNKDRNLIHSVRTAGAYRETLERTARWMQARGHVDGCRNMSAEDAAAYLTERAENVTQKTLNQERQALQKCLPQFDGVQLPRIKATKPPTPLSTDSRAYTREQIERIRIRQREDNAFSTHLVATTGIRGIELYTIRRLNEQPSSSHRRWNPERFAGREDWASYSVLGKGGLVREIRLPPKMARELEARRRETPRTVTEREVKYEQHYDIAAGKSWATSFSEASRRELSWTTGGHGPRHTYAQERFDYHQGRGPRLRGSTWTGEPGNGAFSGFHHGGLSAMKRLAWIIILVLAVEAGAYFWLTPYVEPYRAYRSGDIGHTTRGWEVLHPWAAWPVLVGYSAPLLVLIVAGGWVVAKTRMAEETPALAKREAAADAQIQQARRIAEEAKQSKQRDQALVAEVKRNDVQLSRQAAKEKNRRIRAVGELKRRREREDTLRCQLADANREIERLKKSLPKQGKTG